MDIINTEVRPADLSLFFWQHLNHDMNMLSLSLGKSEDDACLLMHLILKQLSSVTGKKIIIIDLFKSKQQALEI